MKDVQCRYCKNAYVDWDNNCAKCIKLGSQMTNSKGKCLHFKSDKRKERVNE